MIIKSVDEIFFTEDEGMRQHDLLDLFVLIHQSNKQIYGVPFEL